MSKKTWKDDDKVLVFIKFRGTHKGTRIKVSYLQYKNSKVSLVQTIPKMTDSLYRLQGVEKFDTPFPG